MKKKSPLLLLIFILISCTPSPQIISTPTLVENQISPSVTPALIMPNCGSIDSLENLETVEDSLFPAISQADMAQGPEDAATTIIIYVDFQDPASAALNSVLIELREKYPEDLQIVHRDFPLVTNLGHEKAGFAAHAVHAANLQGKFWEMHTLLFAEQEIWSPLTEASFIDWLVEESEKIEIDSETLLEDMQGEGIIEKVREAFIYGQEIGIPFTPFILINGQIYDNLLDFYTLDSIVALYALGERQFTTCPPMVIDLSKEYLATLETEKGDIIIQFYPEQAPLTVNNFIFLAKEGWFDGVTFHRVLPGFFAETGDPSETGQGNPGYFFENEIDSTLSFNRPGVLAMKNVGEGTNGSQFFITYAALPSYDGRFTIFGQVLSGMEVLEELSPREAQFRENPPSGDRLLSVTIEER
ncbi:MAG: thioredoxin domain-containing protein [Anaerolineae bacterium]|jgi:cyclophilin family peptidyl-prolyl cis-trans isomerase/protein-disulfide isomerase|nr:thioredoxin domain-containing protein [Anaerolineae bacterium]